MPYTPMASAYINGVRYGIATCQIVKIPRDTGIPEAPEWSLALACDHEDGRVLISMGSEEETRESAIQWLCDYGPGMDREQAEQFVEEGIEQFAEIEKHLDLERCNCVGLSDGKGSVSLVKVDKEYAPITTKEQADDLLRRAHFQNN